MSNLTVPHDPRRVHLAHMLAKVRGGDRAKMAMVAKNFPELLHETIAHWANSAPVHHHRHRPATVPTIKATALTSQHRRSK